ncbi:MAG: YtxH domain-containing protein [Paludibacteraceae bacterium]|jgi:gas vesicle protein|nr:YtxH domain-containing protein [Paludibacteraceae bacterium]
MANNAGKVIAALLGGAVLGAAAALLLAPKSGAETRQQIRDIVREKGIKLNKDELDALCSRVIGKVRDYFTDEELEDAVEEALDDVKDDVKA